MIALQSENTAQQGLITTLQTENAAQETTIAELEARISALEAGAGGNLETRVTALETNPALALGPFVQVEFNDLNGLVGLHILWSGVNMHVRSGAGSTDEDGIPTGLGNCIVGYNEAPADLTLGERAGSHNLIVGAEHRYSDSGELVAGFRNRVRGPYASVSGGFNNEASGPLASVSGGFSNVASGSNASVSGGKVVRLLGLMIGRLVACSRMTRPSPESHQFL